jgi:hypothetical protein
MLGVPMNAIVDDVLMIEPLLARFIDGKIAFVPRNTPT